jgi:hypothetical protein
VGLFLATLKTPFAPQRSAHAEIARLPTDTASEAKTVTETSDGPFGVALRPACDVLCAVQVHAFCIPCAACIHNYHFRLSRI